MNKYKPTVWKDSLYDEQDNRVQKGTDVKASIMNNIEQGIVSLEKEVEGLPKREELNEVAQQLADTAFNLTNVAVGDGAVDDTEAIRQALNSGYKKFIGASKTYRITSQIVIPDGISLSSINFSVDYKPTVRGDAAILLRGSNSELSEFSIDGKNADITGIIFDGCSNSSIRNGTVKNCKWSGIMTDNAAKNIKISNVDFKNVTGTFLGGAVQIQKKSENVMVEFCAVDKALGKGFVATDCKDVTFLHCRAIDSEYENFYPSWGAERIKIENCVAFKNNIGVSSSSVKCSRGAKGVVFDQCLFEQYGGTGVVSPFHNQGCSDIVVRNSIIRGNTGQCVLLSWHPEDANTNPITPATPANNLRFEDCEIDGVNGSFGIRIDPSGNFTHMEDIIVDGCVFKNYKTGIYALHVKGLKILDNTFEQSEHQVNSVNPIISIRGTTSTVKYSSGTTIIGNTIKSSVNWAIQAYYTENITITDNTIEGKDLDVTLILFENTVSGNVTDNRFKTFNTGINLNLNTKRISISDNFFDNSNQGVAIRQNGSDQMIYGNKFIVLVPITPTNGGVSSSFFLNNDKKIFYDQNPPTAGEFKRGDIVYNNLPSSGGYLGWVCIGSGTPGVWKGFGLIQS